jgi:hypothetical protein
MPFGPQVVSIEAKLILLVITKTPPRDFLGGVLL